MKRNHWTNEEVIGFLEDFKKRHDGDSEWNMALDIAISQFWDFKRDPGEFGAMAYDLESKEIVVIGPPLPR